MTDETLGGDDPGYSAVKEEAAALATAAINISNARESGDPSDLSAALDANMELWIAIRTVAARPDNALPREVRDNLVRLSEYVAGLTVGRRDSLSDGDLDSLININLQISEGLLEGEANAIATTAAV